MANMFNEDGTYNKTEWKPGDKISAGKLNKIESSLEAINNNDISRHVEADTRLDALEESMGSLTTKSELKTLETLVKDNKDATDLEFYKFEGRITQLISDIEKLSNELVDIQSELNSLLRELNSRVLLDLT